MDKVLFTIVVFTVIVMVFGCDIGPDTLPPHDVSNLMIEKTDYSITLRWDNPEDEDFDHVIITYGIGTPDSTYTGTIDSTGTTIEDLTVGESYVVVIQSVGDSNNISEGITRTVYLEDTIAPKEVSNLTSKNYDGAVLISYNSPDDEDFSHYEISISPNASSESPLTTEHNSFYLSDLINGTNYLITIKTVDLAGNTSSGISVGSNPEASSGSLEVGDLGPSGGYIFYDKGEFTEGWRFLEAASTEYENIVWGGYRTNVGGTGTAIGTGASNTSKIVAAFGDAEPDENKRDYAAKVCTDLVMMKDSVAYEDWFLPSQDELNEMYTQLLPQDLGYFHNEFYWSSSEDDSSYAWGQIFTIGVHPSNLRRDGSTRVKPVRAF